MSPYASEDENFDARTRQLIDAARQAEHEGLDKGIEGWRKVALAARQAVLPRRELARLLREGQRWNALADALRELADRLDNGRQGGKVEVLFELAELYRDRLRLDVKAAQALGQVLQVAPGDERALDALAEQYQKGRRWLDLAGVLQQKVEAAGEDRARRLELLLRIAGLHRERLSNHAEAARHYQLVLEIDPEHPEARGHLKELYDKRRDWDRLVALLSSEAERAPDARARLGRYLELAQLATTRIKKPALCIELWRRVAELEPAHAEALAELERLYERERAWEDLAGVIERRIEGADPPGRAALLARLGPIYGDRLDDAGRAVDAWRRLLADDPRNLRAQEALKKIYLKVRDWDALEELFAGHGKLEELIRLLEREAEAASGTARVELLFRAARIWRERLGKDDRAARAYEKVLALDPDNLPAAEALIPIYQAAGDSRRLAGVLEVRIRHTADPGERLERLGRLCHIAEHDLRDAAMGARVYRQAFLADPAADWARDGYQRLAPAAGAAAELADDCRRALDAGDDPALRAALLAVLVRVCQDPLGDDDGALRAARELRELDPSHAGALDALERIHLARDQYAEVIDVLERKLELAADGAARADLLGRLAALHDEASGDPVRATDAWERLLGLRPDDLPALRALDRLYRSQGRDRDLLDLLPRELARVAPDDAAAAVEIKQRLADLCASVRGDRAAALALYGEILAAEPGHAPARAALEAMLADAPLAVAAAAHLRPVYDQQRDAAALARVLAVLAGAEHDPARRRELRERLARLHERLGDATAAIETLADALRDAPEHAATRADLERLAGASGDWDTPAALYGELADRPDLDEDARVALLARAAEILDSVAGDPDRAVASWRRVLDLRSDWIPAIEALERLHTARADHRALVDVLLQKADVTPDAAARRALQRRAAEICERDLADPDGAIEAWRRALADDARDAEALDSLERLYVQLERWGELDEVYARKAALAERPQDKKNIFYVLAQVQDSEFGNPDKAIEAYRSVLAVDRDDEQAILALERLYAQTERHADLVPILRWEVAHARSPAEAVSAWHRLGSTLATHLHRAREAIDAWKAALDLDRAHAPTLQALGELLEGEDAPLAAADVLEPVYRQSGRWEALARLIEVRVAHASGPARADLLRSLGGLCEQRLGDPTRAFAALLDALAAAPPTPDLVADVERLATITGAWEPAARALVAEAPSLPDPAHRADLLVRAARATASRIGRPEDAIDLYREALDHDPSRRDAIEALDEIYTGLGRWADVVDAIERALALGAGGDARAALLHRLGRIGEQHLGEHDRALACYREVLSLVPGHEATIDAIEGMFDAGPRPVEAAAILEGHYRASGRWDRLLRLFEALLPLLPDRADRLARMRDAAAVAEGEIGEPALAFHWWGRALREAPGDEIASQVERLAAAIGGWEDVVALYAEVIEAEGDPAVRRDLLLRSARVCEHELRDPARAEAAFQMILEADPADPRALAELDRLYVDTGRAADLIGVLRRRVELSQDLGDLVALQLRLGSLYVQTGDDEQAVDAFAAVLQAEPAHAGALDALERLHFSRARWDHLMEIYRRMADAAAGDGERAAVWSNMARVASDALGDAAGARSLWERVLTVRPDDATALAALADLHEAAEEWEAMVEVLRRHVRAASSPEARTPLLFRAGQVLHDRLGRADEALDCFGWIVEHDPLAVRAHRAIVAILRARGEHDRVAESLRALVEAASSSLGGDEVAGILAEVAELEATVLGRPEHAIEAWRRVVAIRPGDTAALEALAGALQGQERWSEAVESLSRKAEASGDAAERVDALLRAGALLQERLGDAPGAAGAYHKALEADPACREASLRLEPILRAQGDFRRVVEILMQRLDHAGDAAERIATLRELARVYERELDQPDSAFVALQAAFREDYADDEVAEELERVTTATARWPDLLTDFTQLVHTIADRRTAADLWARIGRWYGEHLSQDEYAITSLNQAFRLVPEHAGALTGLAAIYRRTGRWEELARTLARQAERERDDRRRLRAWLELGELCDARLQDVPGSINAYRQALRVEPDHLGALEALDGLYRRAQAWDQLVEVVAQRAERLAAAGAAAGEVGALWRQAGELWEDRLAGAGRAIDAYRRAAQADPADRVALRALARLYDKTGQTDQQVEVLDRQLEIATEAGERCALLSRLAAIWEEQLGQPERACECLERLLHIDPRQDAAYRSLRRLYRAERDYTRAVDVLRRHLGAAHDPADRSEILAEIGRTLETDLRDPEGAADAWRELLAIDPAHAPALSALVRIFESTRQWPQMAQTAERLIETLPDPAAKVEMCFAAGKVHDQHLRDPAHAERLYEQALAIDAGHLPSMLALADLLRARGEWSKAAQMLVRAEPHAAAPDARARLLFDAATIARDQAGDHERAVELLKRTIEADPGHVEAALALSDELAAGERWGELEPVVGLLLARAGELPPERQRTTFLRAAQCAHRTGRADLAIEMYQRARELAPDDIDVLRGLSDTLLSAERHDQAYHAYAALLDRHYDALDDAERVAVYGRMGSIRARQGDAEQARAMFEEALRVSPGHRPTLAALIDLHQHGGDWQAVIDGKRKLCDGATDPERFAILCQIGDLYAVRLSDPAGALEAFNEALAIKPDDLTVLNKVALDLYPQTGQHDKAVETVQRIAALPAFAEEPLRRGKYHYTAAVLYRDALDDTDKAIELFNQALDAAFERPEALRGDTLADHLKAFFAIDKVLTAKKDWPALRVNYRRMLQRVLPLSGLDVLKVNLWHNLGEIYRTRAHNIEQAITCFEEAVRLDPEDEVRHRILAELYVLAGPDATDKAVAEHQLLLRRQPGRVESYRALADLYQRAGQYDKAWCVAGALAMMNQADAAQVQFYQQYRPQALPRARAPITAELWSRNVVHPAESPYLTSLLYLCGAAVYATRARPAKEWGLKAKQKVDPGRNPILFARVLHDVQTALAMPPVDLYLAADRPGGMQVAITPQTPSLLVGSELLSGRSDRQLAFLVARQLTQLRPEHVLRPVLGAASAIKLVALAAFKLVRPDTPVPGAPGLDALVAQIGALVHANPAVGEQLAQVVQRYSSDRVDADLARWMSAVDLTAARAGLVACGDIAIACGFVAQEPGGAERSSDLLLYSVSEEYFAVRRHLGLAIA